MPSLPEHLLFRLGVPRPVECRLGTDGETRECVTPRGRVRQRILQRRAPEFLSFERIDDSAEGSFDFPFAGEISVEEIGEQRDRIDDERFIEQPPIAATFELVERQHREENDGENQSQSREEIRYVTEHARDCKREQRLEKAVKCPVG